MRLTRLRLVALAATLLVTACGLSVVGTGTGLDAGVADAEAPDGNVADNEVPDTSFADVITPDDASDVGADADAEPQDACAGSCPALITVTDGGYAGFFPVAVVDPSTPCPTGYVQTDGFEKPSAAQAAGACSCGACAVSGGQCDPNGMIQFKHGDDANSCNLIGSAQPINNGNCRNNFTLTFSANDFAATMPPATQNGTCAVTTNAADKTKVTPTKHRTCAPTSCGEQLCDLDPGTKVCLAAIGDVACPAQAPNKTSVGTDFNVTCANCTCGAQTTCGGTLTLYGGNNCNMGSKDYPANTCLPSGINNSSYSFAQTTTSACMNVAAGQPTTALTGLGTICCPP